MDKIMELLDVGKVLQAGGTDFTILSHIDLTFYKGEYCAIVGNSGSGKSTLLYLLGALDHPSSGKIIIDGSDLTSMSSQELAKLRNEKIGFVFQFHYILPEFNALENVVLPMMVAGKLSPRAQKERAEMLLATLGLADRMQYYPSQLSGGQLQRVAIARALANEPLLVLADEPTGNLDSRNSEVVFNHFRKLNEEFGQTFIIVTHNTNFVKNCDRIITLEDGRVLSDTVAGSCLRERSTEEK